jgi:hypothetical protein
MRSHHSLIALAPLDRDQVRHMVGELAPRHALPKEVVEGVTERTGGVPLFVEEVTRLLLEQGEQGGAKAIFQCLKAKRKRRPDDKEQSKLFIKKAREIGADKERSRSDELIGSVGKKAARTEKQKARLVV